MQEIVFFDVDSTASEIEGINQLAAMQGEEIAQQVEHMTNEAMNLGLRFNPVLTGRLEIIRPTLSQVQQLGDLYRQHITPGAVALINKLHRRHVDVHLVSGGFRIGIDPLADELDIPRDRVHAVDLDFNADGTYHRIRPDSVLAKDDGKLTTIMSVIAETETQRAVLIGDGKGDMKTAREAGIMGICFTGHAQREQAMQLATVVIDDLEHLYPVLEQHWGQNGIENVNGRSYRGVERL